MFKKHPSAKQKKNSKLIIFLTQILRIFNKIQGILIIFLVLKIIIDIQLLTVTNHISDITI